MPSNRTPRRGRSLPLCLALVSVSLGARAAPAPAAAPPQPVAPQPVAEKTLDFGTLLSALAKRTVSAAQPSLPEPRRARSDDERTGFYTPGNAPVSFPLQHTKVYAQVAGNVARVEVTQLYQQPDAETSWRPSTPSRCRPTRR